MKNVFDGSSDSEPESAPPPPKKFKPPASICEKPDHDEKSPNVASSPVKSSSQSTGNNFSDSEEQPNTLDLGINDSDDEGDSPRYGLGANNKFSAFNQKASLNQSIIDENSIGYKIMERMGYKPGQTIGSSKSSNALSEPLPIRAKPTRGGVGMATFKPKIASEISSESASNFTDAVKNKHTERHQKLMITKLQKYCFQASGEDLELEKGALSLENVNTLWREYVTFKSNNNYKRTALFGERGSEPRQTSPDVSNHVEDLNNLEDKLKQLIKHARETFHYCPYCGISYDNDTDLNQNCPGDTEQVHQMN